MHVSHIDVLWHHNNENYPVRLISELDKSRMEIRKIEIYGNGQAGYAAEGATTGDTQLGILPVPPLAEINAQNEFSAASIEEFEFEKLWKKYVENET